MEIGDKINLDRVREIVELMKEAELQEFSFEQEGVRLHLKRALPAPPPPAYAPPAPLPPAAAPAAPGTTAAVAAPTAEAGVDFIRSPMVGTFYRSPSPESPPFIETRDRVKKDTVVCIVEAMKVMNEIQSELAGSITEVLVENGETVEYGQPLFKVKLDG
ncbi:MAG: acetyl-CoA carboxylase biotin carboxyl carrier protein [Opitutales bacterium]